MTVAGDASCWRYSQCQQSHVYHHKPIHPLSLHLSCGSQLTAIAASMTSRSSCGDMFCAFKTQPLSFPRNYFWLGVSDGRRQTLMAEAPRTEGTGGKGYSTLWRQSQGNGRNINFNSMPARLWRGEG
ncbi:hypothetical protein BaRGS_00014629 [Batillaria attramentaria]|uniref:Uncharacterized protein n=1 Tax=Batillaria attramentaria TaxID=370345 RepID=A0ABD0L3Q3_9CAEN